MACNSGSSGLHLAAMVAGLGKGDEVLVPTLTFIAAVNPTTRYVGAEPVFIGCDDSLCMDPAAAERFCAERCELQGERLIDKATGAHVKAIVVVHVFGNMADMPAFLALAEKYHLILIEDATEALGTHYTEGPSRASLPAPSATWRVQLQRQQDHHHRRGRHGGFQPSRLGRARKASFYPGQGG